MKTIKLFGILFLTAMTAFSMVSCGDDDEDIRRPNGNADSGSGGSGSATALSCPDNNHPHAVDLGLPSGTKWACCNVGETTPVGIGLFFAWGETTGYGLGSDHNFNWASYKWCVGSDRDKMTKYNTDAWRLDNPYYDGKTRLESDDDAAHVNWGGSWKTPNDTQMQELLDNTTHKSAIVNGAKGRLMTSTINGKRIFLPCTTEMTNYMTSDLYDVMSYSCKYIGVGYGVENSVIRTEILHSFTDRCKPFLVRPVR